MGGKKKEEEEEEKKFKPVYSSKVKNANLYAAIVNKGGDKRVAALAAKKHSSLDPNSPAGQAYVKRKQDQSFRDQLEKKPAKPKRVRKSSPVRNRRSSKK